jgi:hypothetical protein
MYGFSRNTKRGLYQSLVTICPIPALRVLFESDIYIQPFNSFLSQCSLDWDRDMAEHDLSAS